MARVLISTTGISLKSNLERLPADDPIRSAWENRDWPRLCRQIRAVPMEDRLWGAEINTIDALWRQGQIAKDAALHFCMSDTDGGRQVQAFLRHFFEQMGQRVQVHETEGLDDRHPVRFKTHGLRNTARLMGKIIRDSGGKQFVAINATGGYKAQVAIASLIGQAMQVPVYYMHEHFKEIIKVPPMPIAFDYDLLGRTGALLVHVEHNGVIEADPADIDEEIRPLLEEIPGDHGKRLWELGPIGQIFLDGFRERFASPRQLPQAAEAHERRPPKFRDHHLPDNFKDYVMRVWQDTPYVKHAYDIGYEKQQSLVNRDFYIRPDGAIIGTYNDRKNFGGRFALLTTAETPQQKHAAMLDLAQRFSD